MSPSIRAAGCFDVLEQHAMALFAAAYKSPLQMSRAEDGTQLALFAMEGRQVCLAKRGREVVAQDLHGRALACGPDVAITLVALLESPAACSG